MPGLLGSLDICGLILTYNEEPNIRRTLASLSWLPRILVIDSGSTDATLSILQHYPNVELLQRPFDSFAAQCNAALQHLRNSNHPSWLLSLDADYFITPALAQEIQACLAQAPADLQGFRIPFRYCVGGRPLRAALLPPRLALYRLDHAVYENDGHSHRVCLHGRVESITQPILHDDRKPLSRWLDAQRRYLPIEVDKLLGTPSSQLSAADRLRKQTPFAPLAVLLLCLLFKGGLLDGWRGWFYAIQRFYVELLLWLLLTERRRLDISISPASSPLQGGSR